jgi:hypothetical protein
VYRRAKSLVGKPVVCRCKDGTHYGIIRGVTTDGIWLERIPNGGIPASADSPALDVETADRPAGVDGQEVFWPLFFLPFFTLLALDPWYAYPGYYGYSPYFW